MESNICQIVLECIRRNAQTVAKDIQPFLANQQHENGDVPAVVSSAFGTVGAVGGEAVGGPLGAAAGTALGVFLAEQLWKIELQSNNRAELYGYSENADNAPVLFAQMLAEDYGPDLNGFADDAKTEGFYFDLFSRAIAEGVFDAFLENRYMSEIITKAVWHEDSTGSAINFPSVEDLRGYFLVPDPYSQLPEDSSEPMMTTRSDLDRRFVLQTMNDTFDMGMFQEFLLGLTQEWVNSATANVEVMEKYEVEVAQIQQELANLIGNLDLQLTPLGIQLSNHEIRIWEIHDKLNTLTERVRTMYTELSSLVNHPLLDDFQQPNRRGGVQPYPG